MSVHKHVFVPIRLTYDEGDFDTLTTVCACGAVRYPRPFTVENDEEFTQ